MSGKYSSDVVNPLEFPHRYQSKIETNQENYSSLYIKHINSLIL